MGQVEWLVCSDEWASCSVLVRQSALTIVNNALGWVSKLTCSEEREQVAIFNVCYKWRICSVWQVAWCGIDIWAIIHMTSSERCNLLPFFGRVVWGTTRREPRCDEPDRNVCAIDGCQLLTTVIADVCREWVFIFTDLQRMADLFDLIMLLTEWKHLSVRRHMNSCSYVRTRLTDLTSCDMC